MYTDLIPEGVVGCSSGFELEHNNVCRCHKLAHVCETALESLFYRDPTCVLGFEYEQ